MRVRGGDFHLRTLFDRAYRRSPSKADLALSLLLEPCAWLLRFYRRYGSAKLPRTTGMLREMGLFPILNYYYEPFFMPAVLQKPL